MNERIKELAEQASLELFNDTAHHRLLKGFEKKFAELIIKECTSVVDRYGTMGEVLTGSDLLEHFGIN